MPPTDYKRELKHLYQPSSRDWVLVDVPPMQFLMIDGHGDPNTAPAYREALEALYALAYRLKFASKAAGFDYVVPPLEGLWWAAETAVFAAGSKDDWDWTMMIMQPPSITAEMVETARQAVARAKNPPALPRVRLEAFREGLALQILHVGSYDDEVPTLARLHAEVIPQRGYVERGKHHEIYLSDPTRVAPEKLKTVLRQPVREAN